MEANIDNRHHWFEIQNRIVERGEIYKDSSKKATDASASWMNCLNK